MSFTLQDIANAEEVIQPDQGSSYIRAYPEFLKYFNSIESINIHNFIIGAHFVYGWMPTILELKSNNNEIIQNVVDLLNEAKRGILLREEDIIKISKVVNNSLVGTSKILHFVNPKNYAIWDSRVYWFWGRDTPYQYRIQDPHAFMSYLKNCEEVSNAEGFELVHKRINEKIGYEVGSMRAIEWVAYKAFENRVY